MAMVYAPAFALCDSYHHKAPSNRMQDHPKTDVVRSKLPRRDRAPLLVLCQRQKASNPHPSSKPLTNQPHTKNPPHLPLSIDPNQFLINQNMSAPPNDEPESSTTEM